MKIKLRDMTEKQYQTWLQNHCDFEYCNKCPFNKINCTFTTDFNWIKNKNFYSDKFLNQEVEIEVPELLTKEEKEYLENFLKPFKEVIDYIIKTRDNYNIKEFIVIRLCNGEEFYLPYFNLNEYYKNMKIEREYTLKDLGLFQTKYKITLTEFWNSKDKLAIHCDTEEKANKLLKAFDKYGKKWNSGDSYLQYNFYETLKEIICYSNRNTFGGVNDYKEDNVIIYDFDEVNLER